MAVSNINFIVVGISQNNYYTLLKKFMNHLERRKDGNGWVIISKPNHEINNFRNEIEKHRNQDLWTRTDEGEYTLKFSPLDTSQEKGLRNEPLDKNEQWEPFVINNSLKDTNHSEYILMGRGWTDKN